MKPRKRNYTDLDRKRDPDTFRVWYNLATRKYSKYYLNRPIDQELYDSYNAFLKEVGPRPSRQHSLDRINNNLGYCKGNIRWATQKQQVQNSASQKYYILGRPLAEVARAYGIDPNVLRNRLRRGWSLKDSINVEIDLSRSHCVPRPRKK
jgi:hypothetical protein